MNDSIPSLGQFIEPAPVSFRPDAPGWYVVAALVGLFILLIGLWFVFRYYKNRYRREAVKHVEHEEQRLIGAKKYTELIYIINALMKKITMVQHGREQTASLQGSEWLTFLNEQCRKPVFEVNDEQLLARLYLADNLPEEGETVAFVNKAKQWIKQHRYASVRL